MGKESKNISIDEKQQIFQNDKAVYQIMKKYLSNGFSFCSQRMIASELHCAVSTVNRSIERLKSSGIITMKTKGVYQLKEGKRID